MNTNLITNISVLHMTDWLLQRFQMLYNKLRKTVHLNILHIKFTVPDKKNVLGG